MTITIQEATRRAVLFFLKHPDAHTTGVLARRADTYSTTPYDPEACRWCFVGRIAKELNPDLQDASVDEIDVYAEFTELDFHYSRLIEANDIHGLDAAIELAKKDIL